VLELLIARAKFYFISIEDFKDKRDAENQFCQIQPMEEIFPKYIEK
jgi:hypothetical protein